MSLAMSLCATRSKASASAPAAPVATAASSPTQTSFAANWNAVTGATSYRLDVATDSGFASLVTGFNNLNVGNVTTKSVTGLANGTTYFFRVRAVSAGGTSGNSNTVSQVTIPAQPTLSLLSVTDQSVTFQWTASPGATSYELEIADDEQFLDGEFNQSVGNVLTFSWLSAGSNTTYSGRVRAVNSAGVSPNSNEINNLWTLCVAPNAAYDGADTVACNLADSQQSNGAAFRLYRETESGDVLDSASPDGQTSWNFDVSGMEIDTNVHVTAVNAGGESDPSASQDIYNP